jgi:hypothetical protein
MRRIRCGCCARAASGHRAAEKRNEVAAFIKKMHPKLLWNQ